jgi:hypothetical protein
MLSQAPRKRSNQAKLMLGTSVGIKTLAQARFHTASVEMRLLPERQDRKDAESCGL